MLEVFPTQCIKDKKKVPILCLCSQESHLCDIGNSYLDAGCESPTSKFMMNVSEVVAG